MVQKLLSDMHVQIIMKTLTIQGKPSTKKSDSFISILEVILQTSLKSPRRIIPAAFRCVLNFASWYYMVKVCVAISQVTCTCSVDILGRFSDPRKYTFIQILKLDSSLDRKSIAGSKSSGDNSFHAVS